MSKKDFMSRISGPVLLAPMAGVTDAAYRTMCINYGAGLSYSEMVSAAGLMYDSAATWELTEPCAAERTFAVQLFGHDAKVMSAAAERVQQRLGDRLALIDINMACPVRKVIKKGEGSALMGDISLASSIVSAIDHVIDVPTTVKIRRGCTSATENYLEFASAMADSGAAAVSIHGRFAGQMYRGDSDKTVAGKLATVLEVPVIASGDTYSATDVKNYLDQGVSAVMVARGSYGNPWIFSQANELITTGVCPPNPEFKERLAVARKHVHVFAEYGGHMERARKLVAWYVKGMPSAARLRDDAMHCRTLEDFDELFDTLEERLRQEGE